MRPFGSLLNMAVQHHPEEVDLRIQQVVDEASGQALRGAGCMHDEQDAIEGPPEVLGDEQVGHSLKAVALEIPATLQSAGEAGKVRPIETAVQIWSVQVAIDHGDLLARSHERCPQAEADRAPSHTTLRTGNDHASRRSS